MAAAVASHHHIAGHTHVAHQAHAKTILRNKGQGYAHFLDFQGIHANEFFFLSAIRISKKDASFSILQSGNSFQQLFLTAAGDTRDSQDFAAHGGEAHTVQSFYPVFVSTGKIFYFQAFFRMFRLRAINIQSNLFAYHHFCQGEGCGVFCVHRTDITSLS